MGACLATDVLTRSMAAAALIGPRMRQLKL
jgi:hypothetical protein